MIKYKDLFVVDDDKIYHFILKNLLNKNDIRLTPSFFENGSDAIDTLKQKLHANEFPDLILLDINMPIMDGWQFLEEFRKFREEFELHTDIYVVTSSNDNIDINKAKDFESEIANYFLKPINESDIYKIFTA
ncbi:response regulator [Flavobacterium pallidum]|uniref:Response regulator n=1 Tax=Flavobacterium pallidum TaxID=2172098 RepID=A0A2S1SKZ9_9FLAO|nr:response regulator [Flavobacterium pallidum]AWI27090.1 response regulator [Flavobacterium pallidum]